MVDQTTGEIGISGLDDARLLDAYDRALTMKKHWFDEAGRLVMEIRHRIEAREGSIIPSDTYQCELQSQREYDQTAFTPLKEVFNESDLASCLTLAHEETVTVADKWQTTKVKSLARKYGADAQRIFDKAVIEKPPRLSFKRLEKTGASRLAADVDPTINVNPGIQEAMEFPDFGLLPDEPF